MVRVPTAANSTFVQTWVGISNRLCKCGCLQIYKRQPPRSTSRELAPKNYATSPTSRQPASRSCSSANAGQAPISRHARCCSCNSQLAPASNLMQRRMSISGMVQNNAPKRSGYRVHMLVMRMPPFDPLSAAIRLACVMLRFTRSAATAAHHHATISRRRAGRRRASACRTRRRRAKLPEPRCRRSRAKAYRARNCSTVSPRSQTRHIRSYGPARCRSV
ncbi:hypothetical protein ABIB81_008455 [Bradyrhizobium sp. I1.7.5]